MCNARYVSKPVHVTYLFEGFIQSGDEVREVNGIKVLGKSPDEVIQLMV